MCAPSVSYYIVVLVYIPKIPVTLSGVKSVAVHPGEGGGWLSGFGLDQ